MENQMSTDSTIEPLIIVLDDDDFDEIECLDMTELPSESNKDNQRNVQSRKHSPDFNIISPSKARKKVSHKSKKCRTSSVPFSSKSSYNQNISLITFAQVSNVLTISRTGSIFYCVEDIYSKVFENLCTYEQFLDCLSKLKQFIIKQATLSEKFAIDEQNPKLKIYNPVRYRLISINTSDYLIRLKQLLIENQFNDVCHQFESFISSNQSSSESKDNNLMPTIVNVEENVHITQPTTSTSNEQVQPKLAPLQHLLSRTNSKSISLSRAIRENQQFNFDNIPKLVVRHQKIFLTRTIETLGQLFPTWFTPATYHCIHCFTCDQVYTPRLFMLHIDDKEFANEDPSEIGSIQLLASEKISPYKVNLWNEFCSKLKLYAKKKQIDGFEEFSIN